VSSKMGLGRSVVGRDQVAEKTEKSGRPHSGNFGKRILQKYPMCQLLFWLAFEWIRKALKRL